MEETPKHTCYSSFKISVLLCSVNSSMAGEYNIGTSTGEHAPGTQIVVKMVEEPHVAGADPKSSVFSSFPPSLPLSLSLYPFSLPLCLFSLPLSLSLSLSLTLPPLFVNVCVPFSPAENSELHSAVYATPVAAMLFLVLAVAAVLVVILRSRKRNRDRRVLGRVHSPSLKEVAFLKEEGDPSLPSPSSPGNCSLGDPLEFPRNRLYVYSNKILGMWSE